MGSLCVIWTQKQHQIIYSDMKQLRFFLNSIQASYFCTPTLQVLAIFHFQQTLMRVQGLPSLKLQHLKLGEDLAGACRYAGLSFRERNHGALVPPRKHHRWVCCWTRGKGRRFTGVVGPEPAERHGMRSKVPNFVELRLGFFSGGRLWLFVSEESRGGQ